MLTETIKARGHCNVLSLHKTTFEVTKETHLTPRGDCIIAVAADKSMPDFSPEFKEALRRYGAVLHIRIRCGSLEEDVTAYGSPNLILSHPTDLVVRKSDFICPRTLAIKANKAAVDFNRTLVRCLQQGLPVEVDLRISQ